MNCEEAKDLILESLTGTTPPDRRRALVTHLEDCPSCRREAAGMEHTMVMLRAAPEPRLPEGHWAEFMNALDRRVALDMTGWRRLLRLLRTPRIAWGAAAGTSVVVVALGFALFVQPFAGSERAADESQVDLSGVVTESVVQSLPSMSTALTSWKAGLSAPDVSYELISVGGK
ncbi:MAG: anti-sigma factor family protein [bacterium]